MPLREGGFTHEMRDLRVVFGAGTAATAGDELQRLGAQRALLLSTPRGAAAAGTVLDSAGDRVAGVFDGARVHVPFTVVKEAVAAALSVGADALLAFGGGSAIGAAKAVALETGLPVVAFPTTYSGSEMTRIWGVTDGGGKRTGRDPRVAPRTVIYDPLETLDLPVGTSVRSGMNALAHAVEATYAPDVSPPSILMAEEGVRIMATALPSVKSDPTDVDARSSALYGAYLCGSALDHASMGLHHKLAHVLGGSFDLPHAAVHAILLPHVAAFNEGGAPDALRGIARALGDASEGAGAQLLALNRTLGIDETLRTFGLTPADLDHAAGLASRARYPNPRAATRAQIRAILEASWTGE